MGGVEGGAALTLLGLLCGPSHALLCPGSPESNFPTLPLHTGASRVSSWAQGGEPTAFCAASFRDRQIGVDSLRALSWRLPSLTTFLLRFFVPSSHSGPHRFRRKWHSRSPLTGTNRPPALRVHCLCKSAGVTLVLGLSSVQLTAHTELGLGTEENATEEAQKQLPRSRRNEFGARGHLSLDVKLGYNSLALSSDLEERIT